MNRICLALLLTLAVGLSACCKGGSPYLEKQIGSMVRVQFMRNALGGGSMVVPPNTDVMNGAEVSQSGKLERVEREAIVISVGKKTYWIPKDSILMVVVER